MPACVFPSSTWLVLGTQQVHCRWSLCFRHLLEAAASHQSPRLCPHTAPGSLGQSLRRPVTVHSRLWPGRRVSPASFPRSRGGAHTFSLEFSRWDWCFVQASLPRRLRFGWCLPRSPFPTCPRPRPRGPAEPGEDSMSALTTSCFAWSWHFSLTCFATWECNLHSRHQLCHTAASS